MKIIVGCFVFLFVLVLIRMIYENKHFVVTEYTIRDAHLPKNFHGHTWLLLADLHNCSYGANNEQLIQKIKELAPSAIFVAGDMIVKSKPGIDNALSFFAGIKDVAPIYYVNGNHEEKVKTFLEDGGAYYKDYCGMLKKMGITMVNNSCASLKDNDEKVFIHGLNLDLSYYEKRKKELPKDRIDKFAGRSSFNQYDILLAHNPEYFKEYSEYGVNLILAGHNHGGMVYLPLVGGVLSTRAKFFPKYDKGVFEEEDTKMVLSGGLGSHTIKVRLFNQPEIVKITVECQR